MTRQREELFLEAVGATFCDVTDDDDAPLLLAVAIIDRLGVGLERAWRAVVAGERELAAERLAARDAPLRRLRVGQPAAGFVLG